MRGSRNTVPTTERVAVFLTDDERRLLGKWARLAGRHGDVCMSDLGRLAITRLLRTAHNQGSRWLAEQIQLSKEGTGENGNSNLMDLSGNIDTIAV